MTDYVTVVSVDNGAENLSARQRHLSDSSNSSTNQQIEHNSADSQFITVLSINDSNQTASTLNSSSVSNNATSQPVEEVIVYRLPGERLGFGLKFQGGTRNAENIQKLFIQSCAFDSPASRAHTSWGHLREGDEIIEIDGIDVTQMTRLECVRCLKESQLAIRLWVRNGEGKAYAQNDTGTTETSITNSSDKKIVKQQPPSPPPVPPRKINKRKSLKGSTETLAKQSHSNEKPFTPPPDAEFYINLFSDENEFKLRGSESDDTGSTISTVVDNFSLHSNSDLSTLNSPNFQPLIQSKSATELAKAIKSFSMLEKEFTVEHPIGAATSSIIKLEECLMRLQPPISFQDETNKRNVIVGGRMEPMQIGSDVYENVTVNQSSDPNSRLQTDYENVLVTSKTTKRTYENVEVKRNSTGIDCKTPPTPLPRQAVPITDSKPTALIPLPRSKATNKTDDLEEIHDCKVVPIEEPTDNKENEIRNQSELPRLINFLPKVVASDTSAKPAASDIVSQITEKSSNSAPVVRKCIPMVNDDFDDNYVDSSSDEDEEKIYEPNASDRRDSSDTLSDEEGEKLGPPDIIDGPGPSEAYFNFHWSPSMLPTIGEVEEEFSSLEQQTGSIVICALDEKFEYNNNKTTNNYNKPQQQQDNTDASTESTKKSAIFTESNNLIKTQAHPSDSSTVVATDAVIDIPAVAAVTARTIVIPQSKANSQNTSDPPNNRYNADCNNKIATDKNNERQHHTKHIDNSAANIDNIERPIGVTVVNGLSGESEQSVPKPTEPVIVITKPIQDQTTVKIVSAEIKNLITTVKPVVLTKIATTPTVAETKLTTKIRSKIAKLTRKASPEKSAAKIKKLSEPPVVVAAVTRSSLLPEENNNQTIGKISVESLTKIPKQKKSDSPGKGKSAKMDLSKIVTKPAVVISSDTVDGIDIKSVVPVMSESVLKNSQKPEVPVNQVEIIEQTIDTVKIIDNIEVRTPSKAERIIVGNERTPPSSSSIDSPAKLMEPFKHLDSTKQVAGDYGKQCEVELNLSHDDIILGQKKSIGSPISEEMKCYNKCFIEKYGVVNADGTFNDESAMVGLSSGDPNKYALIEEALPNCKTMGEGKTVCSAVHSILECIMTKVNRG